MRFNEFKNPVNNTVLFEYDPNISDQELKDLIVQRLKTEEDRDMLDKIYQALESSTLDERITGVLAQDEDAKSKLQVFAGIVMNTEGTYDEKQRFIENYTAGYIDTAKLTTPNQVHNFSDWIMGDAFVVRVFNNLYSYTPQGIGAGEFAMAVLSPEIKFAGRSSEDAGDLVINGVMTEVKARTSSGGRFMDARKAKMNQRSVEEAFKKAGIAEIGKGISGKMWAESIRAQIDPKNIRAVAQAIFKGAFAFVNDNEGGALLQALESGDSRQIAHEWGMLSFENYKRMSKFEAMLLLDTKAAKTKQNSHSLYFTDINAVSGVIQSGQPYVVGPEQQVHPQMIFKI